MKRFILLLPVLIITIPVLVALAHVCSADKSDAQRLTESVRAAEAALGPRPKAIADSRLHDFGRMDPMCVGTHVFHIRNDGDAPLELAAGGTTCKCTLSALSRSTVPPGETAEVRLTWNTGHGKPFYQQVATIRTNDPKRASIDLVVKGEVRVQAGADPPEFVIEDVEPNTPTTVSAVLYSQTWEAFTVPRATSTLSGVQCVTEPADPADLARLQATAGYRLKVTLPCGMPSGFFHGTVDLHLASAGKPEPEPLSLGLSGKVLRRLAVYGPGVEENGTIDLGIVATGQAVHRRVLLKVRDPEPDLPIKEIRTFPPFVQVKVTPYRENERAAGLYHMDLAIPPDAPPCAYPGLPIGELHLAIDHPRIAGLDLKLRFAVMADRH